MDFSYKTVTELGEWLTEEKFSESIVATFQEQEVDGEAYLQLTDDQIKSLVKKIGPQAKLISKRDAINFQQDRANNSGNSDASITNSSPYKELVSDYDDITLNPLFNEFELEEESYEPQQKKCKQDDSASILPSPKNKLTKSSTISAWQTITSKRKQEDPLPTPFPLPRNFNTTIKQGLDNKILNGIARAKFITTVAECIHTYKSYPTSKEYNDVAREIIKKWPFLGPENGSFGHLAEALKIRMAYIRKPDGEKRGRGGKGKGNQPAKETYPIYPTSVTSQTEDMHSQERHQKKLQQEWKHVRPNKEVSADLMKRTFPYRREQVLQGDLSVDSLLSKYPPLKEIDQMILELERILNNNVSKAYNSMWEQVCPKIITLAKQETNNKQITKLLESPVDNPNAENNSLLAMALLYYILADSRTQQNHERLLIFVEDDESVDEALKQIPTPQPSILAEGAVGGPIATAKLIIEWKVIALIPSKMAPLVLLSSFYIFNMHYTQGCLNFYYFLENLVLGKKIPEKRVKLCTFHARLNL